MLREDRQRKDRQLLAAVAFGLGLVAPGEAMAQIEAAPDAGARLELFNQLIDSGMLSVVVVDEAGAPKADPASFVKDFEKDFEKVGWDKQFDRVDKPFDKDIPA